eukprot:Lankesteria_metandrocarpae@DN9019_c0_g1_i1.p1
MSKNDDTTPEGVSTEHDGDAVAAIVAGDEAATGDADGVDLNDLKALMGFLIEGDNAEPTAPLETVESTSAPAPVISVPVISAPLISAPLTSAPLISAPLTSAPLISAPLTSAPLISA